MQEKKIPHQGLPRVRDLVRVRHAGGKTVSDHRYEVVTVGPGDRCTIREWPSTAPKGKQMAEQVFHKSGLVVDNSGPELLAKLFPFGGSR